MMKSSGTASKQAYSGRSRLLSEQARSTPPCCCDPGAVELDPTQFIGGKEPGVDGILNLVRQALMFWPRLRRCRTCLEARAEDLLMAFDIALGFLSQAATAQDSFDANDSAGGRPQESQRYRAPGKSGFGSPLPPLPRQGSMQTATSHMWAGPRNDHSPWSNATTIPPMSLGEYTLDRQQGMMLLRSAYCRVSGQIASALYEMRGMEGALPAAVNGAVGDLLYGVLNLVDVFADDTKASWRNEW
jgi:hypothetical protein